MKDPSNQRSCCVADGAHWWLGLGGAFAASPSAGPYLAVAENAASEIARHSGRSLGVPIDVVVTATQIGDPMRSQACVKLTVFPPRENAMIQRAERIRVPIPITYRRARDDHWFHANVVNLSETGVLFAAGGSRAGHVDRGHPLASRSGRRLRDRQAGVCGGDCARDGRW